MVDLSPSPSLTLNYNSLHNNLTVNLSDIKSLTYSKTPVFLSHNEQQLLHYSAHHHHQHHTPQRSANSNRRYPDGSQVSHVTPRDRNQQGYPHLL